jgi:hypothetical protein
MKAHVLTSLASAGVLLSGGCSHKEPEDVTPSATPSVSRTPAEDSVTAGAAGAAGAVTDSAAGAAGAAADSTGISRDTLHVPADTMHMPADTSMTMPSADSAAGAARDSM